jgi:hypothetical protein
MKISSNSTLAQSEWHSLNGPTTVCVSMSNGHSSLVLSDLNVNVLVLFLLLPWGWKKVIN